MDGASCTPRSLLASTAPRERADAARNRNKILVAAHQLIDREGSTALRMDAVAREAGVGVGTVYRRFGDLSTLTLAILDSVEQDFQHDFLAGPPPLGPGAAAPERLRAFLHALLHRTVRQLPLMVVAETHDVNSRVSSAAYRLYRRHVAMLLTEIGGPWHREFCAELLLAPLAGTFITQQRFDGRPVEEIADGLDLLVDAVVRARA